MGLDILKDLNVKSGYKWSDKRNVWDEQPVQGNALGFGPFDDLLKVFEGQLCAMLGPGTSGKSTFLMQLALVSAKTLNRRWLWFSPERTARENLAEMERMLGSENHREFLNYSQMFLETEGTQLATQSSFLVELVMKMNELKEAEEELGLDFPVTDIVIDPMNWLFDDLGNSIGFKESIPMLSYLKTFAKLTKTTVWITEHAKTRQLNKGQWSGFDEPDSFQNGRMLHNKVDSFIAIERSKSDDGAYYTNQVRITQMKAKYSHLYQPGKIEGIFDPIRFRYQFGPNAFNEMPVQGFPRFELTGEGVEPMQIFDR